MLISKFNRIIRSRIVWTILGGIFALSLVVFIGPNTGGCSGSASTGQSEGILNGNPVSSHDFLTARSYELRLRESTPPTEEAQAKLRQRVWARIATLQAAESMGITVSDEEVAAVIQRDPSFTDKRKGAFDMDLYARIISEQLRTSVENFEAFLRQDMILRKMHQIMQAAVWSPASEVTLKLNNVTDLLTVQAAVLRRSQLADAPTVTREDARRVYDERPDMFRIPDRRAVRYVRFPINDSGQPPPSDDEVRTYYEVNADKYVANDTNGPVTIPLDQVRPEIVSNLQHRAAASKARENATDFVIKLQPDRFGKTAKTFDELAAASGLQIQTSRLFSATDRLPEFKAGQDFAKRAFQIDPESRDQAVSDAVPGETAVFVLALHTNIASRLPDFEEVAERATRIARDRKESEMFHAKCAEIRKVTAEAVSAGKSFEEAVAPFRLAVTNFPAFSLYNPNEDEQPFEHADAVKPVVMSLKKGEVSDVVALDKGDDAMLIFMKDRKSGDLLSAETLRPELTARINGYRANLVFSDWQDHLLKVGALDDQGIRARGTDRENSK